MHSTRPLGAPLDQRFIGIIIGFGERQVELGGHRRRQVRFGDETKTSQNDVQTDIVLGDSARAFKARFIDLARIDQRATDRLGTR